MGVPREKQIDAVLREKQIDAVWGDNWHQNVTSSPVRQKNVFDFVSMYYIL